MNNNAIDKPSYYRLKDGTYLEDALWEEWYMMPGPVWDACIYYHRAGHKDGEPYEKDMGKVNHYIGFITKVNKNTVLHDEVLMMIKDILGKVYAKHGNPWEE